MIAFAKLSLFTFALVASSQVLAADISRRVPVSLTSRRAAALNGLIARQTEDPEPTNDGSSPLGISELPAECSSACQPLSAIDNEACINDAKCVCKDQVMKDYASCVSCALDLIPEDQQATKDGLTTTANGLLATLAEGCKSEGIPVTAASIGGSDDKGAALSMRGAPAFWIALGAAAVVMIGL